MKKLSCAVAAAVCVFAAGAAHASSVSYNLTLTSTYSNFGGQPGGGTGDLTVSSAPSTSHQTIDTYQGGGLTGLDFSMDEGIYGDPVTFTLSNADSGTDPTAKFNSNGVLTNMLYHGTDPNGVFTLFLNSDDLTYNVENFLGLVVDAGTISVTPAAAAPEPNSLALLGTGIATLCGVVRRRRVA
jgi:hypothetical protein